MSDIKVTITDNSPEVLAAFQNAVTRWLLSCGSDGETYAKKNLEEQGAVDEGWLLRSISHGLSDDRTVQIGTNNEYSLYIECGTGQYSTAGGGTPKKSWVYFDESDGKYHMAYPQRARPYLKPAVADHKEEFWDKLKDSLSNA